MSSLPPNKPANPLVMPLILIAVMTVFCMGGPIVIALVLQGGERADWPPDRPIEWWTFYTTLALALATIATSLAIGIWRLRSQRRGHEWRGAHL